MCQYNIDKHNKKKNGEHFLPDTTHTFKKSRAQRLHNKIPLDLWKNTGASWFENFFYSS